MVETLRWWLASTVIGLVALPYAFRLFRFLPDRGYTAARTLGALLVVYPLWLLSVLGLLPFSAGSVVLLLGALGAGAAFLAGRDRHELAAHLRDHRALIITAEIVFIAALAGVAVLRAYAPAIDATEKPFEFSMFNSVLHSPHMPPADSWFGGASLSYYYGGYLVAAVFTKLTGVPAAYGFNLAVALTGGLVAVAAFGIGANLVMGLRNADFGLRNRRPAARQLEAPLLLRDNHEEALTSRPQSAIRNPQSAMPSMWPALIAGLLSVVLLMVIGNLEGAIELASAHGWLSPSFIQRLGIVNLTGLVRTHHWYPDEFWFWWRATRLGSGWNILEFPFFSFMLGDLHAHLMVLPFTALGLAAVFNLLHDGGALDFAAVRRRPVMVLFLGVLAGMLALSNTWDQPVFLVLLAAAALVLNLSRIGVSWRAVLQALAFVVPVAVLSFILYAPYFANQGAALQGIAPVQLLHPPAPVEGEAMVSPPHHFLIHWGPLLLVTASGIIAQARRRRVWRVSADAWSNAVILVLLPLVAWGFAVVLANHSLGALADEIRARATWWAFGSYWLVQLALLALIVIGGITLFEEARRPHPERRAVRMYFLIIAVISLLLLHGFELFYILEPSPGRYNTVFKFGFIIWLMLATAGGAVVVDVIGPWRRFGNRIAAGAWIAGAAVVLALALVYPVTAAMSRTNGFTGTPTLDGLAFVRQSDPNEYAAETWLAQNLPGRPVVLEASGHVYSAAGRVSGRTGVLTVVGWMEHLEKLRGGRNFDAEVQLVEQRAADVDTIYTTTDVARARDLLTKYGVDYVYVGTLETRQYGTAGMAKFAQLGSVVYQNPTVTIYRVRDYEPALGS